MYSKITSYFRARSTWLNLVLIGAFWAGMTFGFQKIQSDWWFEDDPCVYSFTERYHSPLAFFHTQDSSNRLITEGSGNQLLPMFFASAWMDSLISDKDAGVEYIHQSLSVLAVALGLYVLVLLWLKSPTFAILTSLIWLILPSSVVLSEFLSARSYVEGLLFSILAWICLLSCKRANWKHTSSFISAVYAFTAIAMLYKEYFPTTVLFSLFLYVTFHRKLKLALGFILIGFGYYLYRDWAVGISARYTMDYLNLSDYLIYLSRLPYIALGTKLGYFAFASFALAIAICIYRGYLSKAECLFWSSVLFVTLATIFPVASASSATWRDHGTWYRSVFLLNTVLLLLFVKVAHTLRGYRYASLAFGLIAFSVIPGTAKTIRTWDSLKEAYALEGKFIVENTDKILYSTLPAYWYLTCIKSYHGGKAGKVFTPSGAERKALLDKGEIWSRQGNAIKPDAKLFEELTR